MTMAKTISEMFQDGTIKQLVKVGFCRPSLLNYPIYVETVESLMKQGMNKTQAVIQTSINCRVCERTVWQSIQIIKEAGK